MTSAVRGLLLAGAAALGLGLVSVAAAPPGSPVEPPTAAPTADGEDRAFTVAFLAGGRPLLLKLHVTLDGKPLESAWEESLRDLFRSLDRDGDGVLDRAEAARGPSAQQVRMMRQGGYTYGIGGAATFATLAELDLDDDGKVTFLELCQYFQSRGVRGLQLQASSSGPAGTAPTTRALLRFLDANGDGKLSRDELARAPEILAPLDEDDDELISARELLQGQPVAPVLAAGAGMMAAPARARDIPATVLLVPPIDVPNRLALWLELVQQVLARYDRDNNGTLGRREVELPPGLFDELDKNKDGELDSLEVLKLLRRPADLEVAVRLGRIEGSRPPVAVLLAPASSGTPAPRTDGRAVVLALGDTELDLRRADGAADPPGGQADQLRAAYLQRFRMADADAKGFVSQADLRKPEYRNLLGLFDLADRNGDGQLTEQEFEGYFNVQARLVRDFASLTASEGGRDLFGLLDTNRDGSLGPRELRSAWAALARYDRDGRGAVSPDAVPRQVSLLVGLGTGTPAARAGQPGSPAPPPPAAPARGPVWFRKVDRNRDGDVSEREFLGPAAAFRAIDADGDGLISADEADRYDAAHGRR